MGDPCGAEAFREWKTTACTKSNDNTFDVQQHVKYHRWLEGRYHTRVDPRGGLLPAAAQASREREALAEQEVVLQSSRAQLHTQRKLWQKELVALRKELSDAEQAHALFEQKMERVRSLRAHNSQLRNHVQEEDPKWFEEVLVNDTTILPLVDLADAAEANGIRDLGGMPASSQAEVESRMSKTRHNPAPSSTSADDASLQLSIDEKRDLLILRELNNSPSVEFPGASFLLGLEQRIQLARQRDYEISFCLEREAERTEQAALELRKRIDLLSGSKEEHKRLVDEERRLRSENIRIRARLRALQHSRVRNKRIGEQSTHSYRPSSWRGSSTTSADVDERTSKPYKNRFAASVARSYPTGAYWSSLGRASLANGKNLDFGAKSMNQLSSRWTLMDASEVAQEALQLDSSYACGALQQLHEELLLSTFEAMLGQGNINRMCQLFMMLGTRLTVNLIDKLPWTARVAVLANQGILTGAELSTQLQTIAVGEAAAILRSLPADEAADALPHMIISSSDSTSYCEFMSVKQVSRILMCIIDGDKMSQRGSEVLTKLSSSTFAAQVFKAIGESRSDYAAKLLDQMGAARAHECVSFCCDEAPVLAGTIISAAKRESQIRVLCNLYTTNVGKLGRVLSHCTAVVAASIIGALASADKFTAAAALNAMLHSKAIYAFIELTKWQTDVASAVITNIDSRRAGVLVEHLLVTDCLSVVHMVHRVYPLALFISALPRWLDQQPDAIVAVCGHCKASYVAQMIHELSKARRNLLAAICVSRIDCEHARMVLMHHPSLEYLGATLACLPVEIIVRLVTTMDASDAGEMLSCLPTNLRRAVAGHLHPSFLDRSKTSEKTVAIVEHHISYDSFGLEGMDVCTSVKHLRKQLRRLLQALPSKLHTLSELPNPSEADCACMLATLLICVGQRVEGLIGGIDEHPTESPQWLCNQLKAVIINEGEFSGDVFSQLVAAQDSALTGTRSKDLTEGLTERHWRLAARILTEDTGLAAIKGCTRPAQILYVWVRGVLHGWKMNRGDTSVL